MQQIAEPGLEVDNLFCPSAISKFLKISSYALFDYK